MIAALFALAAVMVIGGCAAVIQGFPYVRLESGMALVVAGSVTASSGAVLLGLGVVASGLRRIERAAGRVPADGSADGPAVLPPASVSEGRPRLPPVLPATPAFVVPPMVEPPGFEPSAHEPPTSEPPTSEPSLASERLISEGGQNAADHASATAPAEPEPELPIPGLTPAPPLPERKPDDEPIPLASSPTGSQPAITPEDDLFAAPEGPDAEETLSLRRSLDAAPDPEPEPAPQRNVVGRYASGGNTYVMFEDGSIEAETPQGRFTFSSLDELKAFVDGGGEAGTRGAA